MVNPINNMVVIPTPPDERVENGVVAIYEIQLSDIRVRKDGTFDFDVRDGVLHGIGLKRRGTYRGKRFDRKFRKITFQ